MNVIIRSTFIEIINPCVSRIAAVRSVVQDEFSASRRPFGRGMISRESVFASRIVIANEKVKIIGSAGRGYSDACPEILVGLEGKTVAVIGESVFYRRSGTLYVRLRRQGIGRPDKLLTPVIIGFICFPDAFGIVIVYFHRMPAAGNVERSEIVVNSGGDIRDCTPGNVGYPGIINHYSIHAIDRADRAAVSDR